MNEMPQGYQGYPVQPATQTSTLAVISLIAGIVSFILLPLLGGIAAIITGGLAKKEIREGGGRYSGEGMATAGQILGWINVVLVAIPVCLIVILALLGPSIGNVFSNIIIDL